MSDQPRKTSLFIYVPVIILSGLLLYLVFSKNFQRGEESARVTPPREGGKQAVEVVDLRALAKDDALAAKGKTLFMTNCASCHGTKGAGDGDRATSLNPKPRNYHTDKFKYGNDVVSLYNTLMKGSAGTSMPSFALLPTEDLWAMVHYVRTLIPNPDPTTDAILAKLPESKGGTNASARTTSSTAAMDSTGPRIPILLAMQRMEQPASQQVAAIRADRNSSGAGIYSQRCASCHGNNGEGKAVRVLNVFPYKYEYTASLLQPDAAWFHNKEHFTSIVTQGLPGRLMPGNATLSRGEIDALYSFVRGFAR